MEYQEGHVADGPNGQTAIFKNGQWEVQGPGYGRQVAEDVTKTIAPSAIRGGVMAGTGLPGIYDMAIPSAAGAGIPKVAQWLADKLPDSWGVGDAIRPVTSGIQEAYGKARETIDKFRKEGATTTDLLGHKASVPPGRVGPHTYDNVMQRVEEGTGPLYQADTFPGKLAQGSLEAAPAIAGGNWIKGLGSVAGSELAGKATEGTWAEPWARLAGGVAGNFTPTGKKAPNPIFKPTPEHEALVNQVQPHVSGLSAGQVTGSPFLQKVEGTAGLSTAPQIPQASAHALSTGGVTSPAAAKGIAQYPEVKTARNLAGQTKSDIYKNNQLRYDQEFRDSIAKAQKDAGRLPKKLAEGEKHSELEELRLRLDKMHDRILNEPTLGRFTGKSYPSSMLGTSAEDISNELGKLVKDANKAGARRVADAAHDTGTSLRTAMDRSLVGGPHESALGPLREQYTNAKALGNVTKEQGSGATLPMDKIYAALLKSKNPNATETNLGQFANAAEKLGVGKDLPKFGLKDAALPGVLGGLGIVGGGAYLHGGDLATSPYEFLSGLFGAPAAAYGAAKYGGKLFTGPRMQSHLPNAGVDKNMLARLLLTQGTPRAQAAINAPE